MARREANRRGEGDQLRAELIAAATDLLVSPQQVAAPSLRAIAREVGVSPSGVYLHFASQDELIAAVIETQYDELRAALLATDRPDAEPLLRLTAMARTYVAWGIEHPGAYQLLFESADALPGGSPSIGTGDALMDGVAALVKAHDGLRPAQARKVAMRIWIALHGLVSLRIHKPHASWDTSAAKDAEALLRAHLSTT
ncbi:MAG: TetR/AcrR family transcriptional regulator [Candidatus Nanopelagicales bacterium]